MNNYNNDILYQGILVEINNTYNPLNARNNDRIIIEEQGLLNDFEEEIKWLKRFKIIDRETNQLNIKRYFLFRNYINRNTWIDWISWVDLFSLIENLKKKYFNNKQIQHEIEILWFTGWVPKTYRFYWYENLDIWSTILFYWTDLYKALLQYINADTGIFFNNINWEVTLNGELLGNINLNTQQYSFFKFLYDNIGTPKNHQEIKEHIIWDNRISKTSESFNTDIKRRIDKPIRDLVSPHNWGYMIKNNIT